MSCISKVKTLVALVLALCSSSATAATIDQFQVQANLSSPEAVGVGVSIYTAHSKALGGGRTLTAMKTSAGSGVGVTRIETTAAGSILGLTEGDHGGFGSVVWDGDTDPNSLKANGLGSLDLTQDGATAFKLTIRSFDYAYSEVMLLTFRIYDPAFPLGNKFSQVDITINQVVNTANPVLLTIPFSLFTTPGASTVSGFPTNSVLIGGGAAATSVGAIAMEFRGFAGDMTTGILSTNGRCSAVPNSNGKVVDECGVCLDDVNNANQGKDACGICYKGPPGYDYDSNKVFDACGLCPANPQYSYPDGNKDSCGLCPTAPNWGNSKDPCGVCFGDGTSCADCTGKPNGTAKYDQCNVCAGDGTTCLDCRGVPFGDARFDACGVCGGDSSSCKDCAGVINGTSRIDVCGNCGGLVTDVRNCSLNSVSCVIVPATSDVKRFERGLISKAKELRARYMEERARSERSKCGIVTDQSDELVNQAFRHIMTRGSEIFSAGVEVCGNSCITTSYAAQVEALKPEFKMLEQGAVSLAKKVSSCYKDLGIPRSSKGGTRGVANTVSTVSRGLNNLIAQCRRKKVCPPNTK